MQSSKTNNIVRFFRGSSLSRNLLLGIIAIVCATMMLIGIYHYSQVYRHALTVVQDETNSRIDNLAEILSLPVWNVDQDTVERVISVFSESETVLRIRIEEPDGKLIADYISDIKTPTDTVISRNIFHNNQQIGRITTHLSFTAFKERQLTKLLHDIAILALLLIAILILTQKILEIYLKRPLKQLSEMIDQLRAGTYSDHYPTLRIRELQQIATNFNEMAKQVALRETELTEINERLQENIEERKHVEYQLRTSQEQFSLIAASTMDGIIDRNFGQDFLIYTPRWKELLGYADGELTNSLAAWLERVHPDDRNISRLLFDGYIYDASGRSEVEYRMLHKDGKYRWLLGRGQVLNNRDGEPYRFICTHSDITPKKHAEQRLISTKEMLQNIINCMPSLIVGVTEQMTVTLWNDTVEDSTAISASDAEGKRFRQLLPELSFIEKHIHESLTNVVPVTVPKVTSIRKGVPVTYDIVIFPVTISSEHIAVLRIDDITKRLRMEERIIQTEKMASISGLAAGMAHEINNPLGGILQGAVNVQRRFSTELTPNVNAAEELGISLEQINAYMKKRQIFGLLDDITESGRRAASIISNMLEFSRSSDTLRVPANIHEIIEKSIDLAANDYLLKTEQQFSRITIIKEFDESVSQISCAPQEIEQVLLNLLKNAAQAFTSMTPAVEKPTIVITTQQSASGVMITVADNGPGMDEDVRKRIFEPFYTTKPVGDGTGLGLSVSYFIITNNHSGTISVTSAKKQGSTFNVYLPHAM